MTKGKQEVGSIRKEAFSSTFFFRRTELLYQSASSASMALTEFGYRQFLKQGLLRRMYFPADDKVYVHMTVLNALTGGKTISESMIRPWMKADSQPMDKKRKTRAAFKAAGYLD